MQLLAWVTPKRFHQNAQLRLQRHPIPPLRTPYPGDRGTRSKKTQEPSPLEDHLHAKFHPNRPAIWISIENKQTHTDIALYILDYIQICYTLVENVLISITN